MKKTKSFLPIAIALSAAFAPLRAGAAEAIEPAWKVSADYVADVSGPVSGGASRRGRVLDNLLAQADVDLARAVGWSGATAHVSLLNNSGGRPNDEARTLQGVDNIEVAHPHAKVYEAWVEQTLGRGSVRVGLYDLNSEFYTTAAASLFIAPAFGVGSELAATGPNGPSIFPSTALAARVRYAPSNDVYIQAAAINAKAGVMGDPGGVDTSFRDGALYIGEAGWTGRGKIAIGAWRYGKRQPKFGADAATDAGRGPAQGVYLMAEQPLRGGPEDVRNVTGFLRLGASDGETTPFNGGAQAGLSIGHLWASRPDATFSAGAYQGRLARHFRDDMAAAGPRPAHAEYGVELTYADKIGPRVTLQPSLQRIFNTGGDRDARATTVATLRVRIHLA